MDTNGYAIIHVNVHIDIYKDNNLVFQVTEKNANIVASVFSAPLTGGKTAQIFAQKAQSAIASFTCERINKAKVRPPFVVS